MFAFQTIAATPGPTLGGAQPEVSGGALAELFAALLAAAGAWARPGVVDTAGPTSDAGLTDLAAPACRGHREALTAASTASYAQPDHFRASGGSPWSGPPLIDPDAADQGLPPLARPQSDERLLRVLPETAFAAPVEIASEQFADKQSDSVQPDRPRSAAAPSDPGFVDQGLPPLAQSRADERPLRAFQETELATPAAIGSERLADKHSDSVQPDRPQSTTPPINPGVVDQGLPPLARSRAHERPLRGFEEIALATPAGIASERLANKQSKSVQPDRPRFPALPIDPGAVDQGLPPLALLRADGRPIEVLQTAPDAETSDPSGFTSELGTQGAPPVIAALPVSIESPAARPMPSGEPPSPFAPQFVIPGAASNAAATTDGWEPALALRLESVQRQPPEAPQSKPIKADSAPPAVTADLIRQPAPASGPDTQADPDSRREQAPPLQDVQPAAAVLPRIIAQPDAPPPRSATPSADAPARPEPPEIHSAELERSPHQTQFRLVLRDDRLGRVSLHLTERAGLIDLMVRADKPATARALQDSLPTLIDTLAQRNFRAESAPFTPSGGSPEHHATQERERRDRRAYEARPRLRARRVVNIFPAAAQ